MVKWKQSFFFNSILSKQICNATTLMQFSILQKFLQNYPKLGQVLIMSIWTFELLDNLFPGNQSYFSEILPSRNIHKTVPSIINNREKSLAEWVFLSILPTENNFIHKRRIMNLKYYKCNCKLVLLPSSLIHKH